MPCELLSSPYPPHRPAYPKIVYHNSQWTSHPDHSCRRQELLNRTFPGDWMGLARRHTLDHINTVEERVGSPHPVPPEKSRKRQKVARSSSSFKRKSLLFFRMLGATDRREGRYEVQENRTTCVRDVGQHQAVRSVQSDPVSSPEESRESVRRTVSDSNDQVVLRRRSGANIGSRPQTLVDQNQTEPAPICPSSAAPLPQIRPASCYVKTPSRRGSATPDQSDCSGLHKKLRRFSASVKNFSLDKMMPGSRKLSGSGGSAVKEETRVVPDGAAGHLLAPPVSRKQRKSLPADFRYENSVRAWRAASPSRKVRSVQ